MNNMQRAKNLFKQAMCPGLKAISLSLLLASACAVHMQASTVFDVSGTYQDGATLSGTINIDTVGNAGVTSANLALISGGTTYDLELGAEQTFFPAAEYWQVAVTSSAGYPKAYLGIFLGNSTNLDGYTGGSLCSDTFDSQHNPQLCLGNESNLFFLGNPSLINSDLVSGSLSLPAANAAPEPAALSLFFTGLCAAVVLGVRRNAKNGSGLLGGDAQGNAPV